MQEEDDNTQELQDLLSSLLEAPDLNNFSAAEAYINSCEECEQKQQEELDVLAAVYGEDFTLLPVQQGGDKMLDIKIRNLFVGENSNSLMFSVNIPASYPNTPPLFDIHELDGFKRTQIDKLWQDIISIGEGKIGQPMLYDMTSYCQEYIANLQEPRDKPSEPKIDPQIEQTGINLEKWMAENEEEEEKRVFSAMEFRSMFRTSNLFSAMRQFEKSNFKVVKVENIRNVHREGSFIQKCKSSKRVDPVWVLHGTAIHNIPSIVARGLLPAGQGGVGMAHGNACGTGIYLAKEPTLSLGYVTSSNNVSRLLLCSLLPAGNVSEYDWGYVCRDGGLILPSYAVDVIYTSESLGGFQTTKDNQEPDRLHNLMDFDFEDLRGKEKMERMKAYASRHLPFGFGSASGDSFQVLEVAPHDDDDDDTTYSECLYQAEIVDNISQSEYSAEIKMTTKDWEQKNLHLPNNPQYKKKRNRKT